VFHGQRASIESTEMVLGQGGPRMGRQQSGPGAKTQPASRGRIICRGTPDPDAERGSCQKWGRFRLSADTQLILGKRIRQSLGNLTGEASSSRFSGGKAKKHQQTSVKRAVSKKEKKPTQGHHWGNHSKSRAELARKNRRQMTASTLLDRGMNQDGA